MKPRRPEIEGWFRKLQEGRLEIYLAVKRVEGVKDRKIRSSGPEAEMFELVDWFERKTGLRVESPRWRRVRTGPKPIAGQIELTMGELPEQAEVREDG